MRYFLKRSLGFVGIVAFFGLLGLLIGGAASDLTLIAGLIGGLVCGAAVSGLILVFLLVLWSFEV